MSKKDKIIKYIALALAFLLIYTILVGTEKIFYFIGTTIGIIENDTKLEELKIISDDVYEVSSIKLDIKATDIEIKEGDKFIVETNNPKIKYTNNNGNIIIEDKSKVIGLNKIDNNLFIYLPKQIQLDELEGNTGAGSVKLSNVTVTNNVKINGGAGEIKINNCSFNNLNLELGVGKTNINAYITGNSKIDIGIGDTTITLLDNSNKLEISTGIGEISLNNNIIKNNTTIDGGKDTLKINGGIGKIDIYTK